MKSPKPHFSLQTLQYTIRCMFWVLNENVLTYLSSQRTYMLHNELKKKEFDKKKFPTFWKCFRIHKTLDQQLENGKQFCSLWEGGVLVLKNLCSSEKLYFSANLLTEKVFFFVSYCVRLSIFASFLGGNFV